MAVLPGISWICTLCPRDGSRGGKDWPSQPREAVNMYQKHVSQSKWFPYVSPRVIKTVKLRKQRWALSKEGKRAQRLGMIKQEL